MSEITRRQFLELSAKFAALMGLASTAIPQVAKALEDLSSRAAPVLWLQGLSCSGCSVSLLNSASPNPAEILTNYISLKFHSTLSAATGEIAKKAINHAIDQGGYFLAIEGSIPEGMPEACVVGGEFMTDSIVRAAKRAKAIISVGSCAAHGGIPAAENNPTGAVGATEYLKKQGISAPIINLPGCPAHPDWIVGSLVHVLKFGLPELDEDSRPKMFYSKLVHDRCPRFPDYERERYSTIFSEDGCLFKLGCMGPVTHADCSLRLWNDGTNFCINAGAPCIGCASANFSTETSFPFYTMKTTSEGKGE